MKDRRNWFYFPALASLVLYSTAMANPVVNGDFESASFSPSTTTYADGTATLCYNEGSVAIVSYDTLHPYWVDFFDHTAGNASGHFMVVNGRTASANGGAAWSQTVTVVPDTDYDLSAWFASVYPDSPANLEFHVSTADKTLVSPTFLAPLATANWQERSFAFNSGNSSSITLSIWDTSGVASGNDYAVDDIKLSPTVVPEPALSGAVLMAGIGLMRRSRRI